MNALLVVLLCGAAYSYFLYPIALLALVAIRRPAPPPAATSFEPSVSFIITAHNEGARIREKLANTLAVDYPKLEIIVASDCSTDDTDEFVRNFAGNGVVLMRTGNRDGKERAQQQAIALARGDILVFSDAGTRIDADSVRRIVGYFAAPEVGAVSSEDRFVREDGTLVGEGAYVRYEMLLRRLESRLGGLVGLSGSFFAARRVVCESWDAATPSDFNTALNCSRLGMKAISAPDVIGYYADLKDSSNEYQRKVRTVLRGMTGLARNLNVLSPRQGIFSWQVFSHKLMRWLVPLFLAGLLVVTAALYEQHWFPRSLFLAQMAAYGAAVLTQYVAPLRRIALLRLIHYFCHVNLAIVHAGLRYLAGQRMLVWQPSAR